MSKPTKPTPATKAPKFIHGPNTETIYKTLDMLPLSQIRLQQQAVKDGIIRWEKIRDKMPNGESCQLCYVNATSPGLHNCNTCLIAITHKQCVYLKKPSLFTQHVDSSDEDTALTAGLMIAYLRRLDHCISLSIEARAGCMEDPIT